MLPKFFLPLLSLFVLIFSNALYADKKLSISGEAGLEFRAFSDDPLNPAQHGNNSSFFIKTELFYRFNKRWTLTFTPFARVDQGDNKRTHADVRELLFHKTAAKWELKLGVSKVFWGVTESQHLVDIINQTDAIEASDREEKLGQTLTQLILKRKSGIWEFFLLPGFRERTFPSINGRPRSTPIVDRSLTQYEASSGRSHIDYAFRWSKNIGIWDVGLSYFDGTSRDPRFIPQLNNGSLVLAPFYDQIQQTGLDIQATKGNWLWKLESIYRQGQEQAYTAVTAGFEYTVTGFMKTRADLGILLEYLYDERQDPLKTPFEDDTFLGFRMTFNDAKSSALLLGFIFDNNSNERSSFVEYTRRLGQSWKLSVEGRFLSNPNVGGVLYSLRQDNFLQVQLSYFF